MPNEADTGRKFKFVVPKLQPAGWDNKPHSIAGQCYFTDARFALLEPSK
jgi:type I restriction enzyme R subunit